MKSRITWVEPPMKLLPGGRGPSFPLNVRFDSTWWRENASFGPPDYQWRSYLRGGEEVARILLALRCPSHRSDHPLAAVMIWNFEVREDLRVSGEHLGTQIIEQLSSEFDSREIYVGPTPDSLSFWERFGWPMCTCDDCLGRDFIVRRLRTL